jgi:opacity protein-like surface antigen
MQPTQTRLLLVGLLLPMTLHAQSTPYIRLSSGLLLTQAGQHQTIDYSPAYWKTDVADKDWVSQIYGGLSAGLRLPLQQGYEAEVGLGLYQTANIIQTGKVYQYSLPTFHNLNYEYQISHQRIMLEGKLSRVYANRYHPYMSAGLGLSCNRSDHYVENPTEAYAVADPAFAGHRQTGMAYAAGVGVDMDIVQHWRVGAGYEYAYLGTAKLGAAPAQPTSQRVSSGSLLASQFMLQITYAG